MSNCFESQAVYAEADAIYGAVGKESIMSPSFDHSTDVSTRQKYKLNYERDQKQTWQTCIVPRMRSTHIIHGGTT
jgi:hypothetical protein